MSMKEEIINFVSTDENYGALLINGKWGSGKTYLIKEIANEENNSDKYAFAIVSLFGIDSIAALNKRVKESVFSLIRGTIQDGKIKSKLSVLKENARNLSSAMSDLHPLVKGLNAALSIDFFDFFEVEKVIDCHVSSEKKRKKLVLVFDDIERSKLDIVELLGVINEYAENKSIKTILIADEAQFRKDAEKNERYLDYKEKVITKTITFITDYPRIVSRMVKILKTKSEGYKIFLVTNEQLIERLFLDSKTENIRTLRSILIEFERVYDAWISTKVPITSMANVIYTFGALMFQYKSSRLSKSQNDTFYINSKEMEAYSLFNAYASHLMSLQEWITTSVWKKSAFIEEISNRFAPQSISADQQFLHGNFWNMNQETFNEGFPIVLQEAYKGELTRDELISFLEKTHALNKYDIALPCEVDYMLIEAGFVNRKAGIKAGDIIEPKRHTFTEPDNMDTEAVTLYKQIVEMDNSIYSWENRRAFIRYINQETDVGSFRSKNLRFDSFDRELLDLFIIGYRNADNARKKDMALTLLDISFDDNFENQAEATQSNSSYLSLIYELEQVQQSTTDQFTAAICRSFIEKIKIDKLKMDKDDLYN